MTRTGMLGRRDSVSFRGIVFCCRELQKNALGIRKTHEIAEPSIIWLPYYRARLLSICAAIVLVKKSTVPATRQNTAYTTKGAKKMETASARLLNVAQVASLLGISERSVWKHSLTGEIPSPFSIGRSQRWDSQDIHEFIANRKAMTQHPNKTRD
jgi:predicted DNA-binding transcriptional regulator AlpA